MAGDLRKCPLRKLEGHNSRVTSCSWSTEQGLLATGSQDGTVRLWDISQNSTDLLHTHSCNSEAASMSDGSVGTHLLSPVMWSSRGTLLAAFQNKLINIWTVRGSQVHVETQPSWVTAMSWVQSSCPFPSQVASGQANTAESLLLGRLDGSLCWLEVSEEGGVGGVKVESTDLSHCQRKEAPQCLSWYSTDRPFAVGYPDGKILLASTDSFDTEQPILLTAFHVCTASPL
uniref:Uncharacterized protein n=1 Tax=Astyanax mexicanus TaxID=7994 RepID=A0A3B1K4X6_ASTMX